MIELTREQHQALVQNGGEPVRVIDPEGGNKYVLLPVEVYDRIKSLLIREEDWAEDAYRASMEAFAPEWNDPRMDAYDALDPRRQS